MDLISDVVASGVANPNFFGGKCLTLGEQQYFCLGGRFSKHKMTRYAKNFGRHGPLATPMVVVSSLTIGNSCLRTFALLKAMLSYLLSELFLQN